MKNGYLLLDVVAVLVFVVVGRRTHDEAETIAGVLRTAAPFMLALAAAWVAAARVRDPVSPAAAPIMVTVTVVGGVLARRFVADEGIATTFIVVTALFLTATMVGWRYGVAVLERRRLGSAVR